MFGMNSELSWKFWSSFWTLLRQEILALSEEDRSQKPIIIDEKIYDPTMRIVFVLYNNHGVAQVNFLGAYWKLPANSLDEQASLTERHKSKIYSGRTSSARVDAQDFENVKKILEPVLCTAYLKMLEITHTH